MHEGQKPLNCSICDASFAQSGNLNKHIKSIHEGQTLKCFICDASFTQGGSLKKHIATLHERQKLNVQMK